MAMLENGVLKLAATKTLGVAFPLGLIAITAIWFWSVRDRRSPASASARDESSAAGSMGEAGTNRSSHEVTRSANPTPREHTSYRPAPGASIRGGTDREALLSQVLEDNIRLREALK